jgi:hypothetical protein
MLRKVNEIDKKADEEDDEDGDGKPALDYISK